MISALSWVQSLGKKKKEKPEPVYLFEPEEKEEVCANPTVYLGAKEQAEEFGHSFEREIIYLFVHSVLHLLGYDHLDEGEQKRQMRSREEAIASQIPGMQRD